MVYNNIQIGKTGTSSFNKAQTSKIQAGIDLLLNALQTKTFEESILSFSWESDEGNIYFRFYQSKNVPNKIVLGQIRSLLPHTNPDSKEGLPQITILPYENRKEIKAFAPIKNQAIWLNLGYINQEWFTPVHIASNLIHEYCINLGLCNDTLVQENYLENSVPKYCANLIMKICENWIDKVTDIQDSFEYIEPDNYIYYPATLLFNKKKKTITAQTSYQHISNLLSTVVEEKGELDKSFDTLSNIELQRYDALEKCIEALRNIHKLLSSTSLDGSDVLSLSDYFFDEDLLFE